MARAGTGTSRTAAGQAQGTGATPLPARQHRSRAGAPRRCRAFAGAGSGRRWPSRRWRSCWSWRCRLKSRRRRVLGGRRRARAARGSPRAVPPTDALKRGDKAVDSVLGYTPFVRAGATKGRDVALTFDDGPGPYTPAVLERARARARAGDVLRDRQELPYFGASAVREIDDGDRDRRSHREPSDARAPLRARPVRRALRTDRADRTARRPAPASCSARPTARSTRRRFACCTSCTC